MQVQSTKDVSEYDEVLHLDLRRVQFPGKEPFRQIVVTVSGLENQKHFRLKKEDMEFHMSVVNCRVLQVYMEDQYNYSVSPDIKINAVSGVTGFLLPFIYGIPVRENPNAPDMSDSRIVLSQRVVTHDNLQMETLVRHKIIAVGHLRIMCVTNFRNSRKLKI